MDKRDNTTLNCLFKYLRDHGRHSVLSFPKKNHLCWLGLDACLLSGPPGFNRWAAVAPAFQCWSCC